MVEETSPDELQTLAGKAGLQAQPTSPLAAQAIGASPDQVKMAASPQVQQSAQQISQLPPSQGLATAQRETQARSQATTSEAAEQAKAEQVKNLGDVGTRVQSAIDAQVAQLAASTPTTASLTPDMTNATIAASTNPTATQTDLQALQANPTDQGLMLKVNQDLGRTTANPLSSAELSSLYQTPTAAIGQAATAGMPTSLTVGQLASQPGFGYNVNDLSGLLGVPAASLAGYSVQQLSAAVTQMQQQEFSKSAQLQQQSTSTNLGTAERTQAQQLGQEASATGLKASEDDVARMQASVANGDQVQFGGQTYSVEDLLSNNQVSNTVVAYLNAPAGSPTQAQLQQTEPDLVKWITANQSILSDAASKMAGSAGTFQATQTANAGVGTYGGQQLAPTVLSAIIPGYDPTKLQSGAIDTSKVPALQYLQGLAPQAAATAVQTINTLTPDQQAELQNFSPSQIAALRLDMGSNSPVMQSLQANTVAQQQIDSVDPKNADQVYSLFTGVPGTTQAQLQAELDQNREVETLTGQPLDTFGGLDSNKDGTLDNPATILAALQKQTTTPTLANAIKGGISSFSATQPAQLVPDPALQDIYTAIGGAAKSGTVSVADLKAAGVQNNPDLMQEMIKTGVYANLPTASQNYIHSILGNQQTAQITQANNNAIATAKSNTNYVAQQAAAAKKAAADVAAQQAAAQQQAAQNQQMADTMTSLLPKVGQR